METGTLTFHITLKNRKSLTFEETDNFSKEFITSLGLKVHSGCWSDINIYSPNFIEFLDKSEELINSGNAIFYGLNILSQNLVSEPNEEFEWYELKSDYDFNYDYDKDGNKTCKAYQIAQNTHIAGHFNQYVSEKFKSIVEQNNLTGIDFLWVKDTGKYKAKQWFMPIAQNPLGRGIDHPWFDPRTLKGRDSWQPQNEMFRTGVWAFDLNQCKKDINFDDDFARLFNLYKDFGLSIRSYRRFLKQYVPKSDFAYIWRESDRETRHGKFAGRELCVNEKAKNLLLENRLINKNQLKPIKIYDVEPEWAIILNEGNNLPGPYYLNEEYHEIKTKLDVEYNKHAKEKKPERIIKLKESLSLFRKSKRERPEDFNKGLKVFQKHSINLPEDFKKYLSIANGAFLCDEFTLASYDEINDLKMEKETYIKSLFSEYPYEGEHIPIGYSPSGDWYSIELNESSLNESKVVRISHEDTSVLNSWNSIPLFFYDMLTGFYD